MHATELKHAANLEEWKKRIMDCRAGGLTVREWCSRNAWSNLNWAKRSIILAAKPNGFCFRPFPTLYRRAKGSKQGRGAFCKSPACFLFAPASKDLSADV